MKIITLKAFVINEVTARCHSCEWGPVLERYPKCAKWSCGNVLLNEQFHRSLKNFSIQFTWAAWHQTLCECLTIVAPHSMVHTMNSVWNGTKRWFLSARKRMIIIIIITAYWQWFHVKKWLFISQLTTKNIGKNWKASKRLLKFRRKLNFLYTCPIFKKNLVNNINGNHYRHLCWMICVYAWTNCFITFSTR